jgi:hypothetical protein
VRLVRIAGPGFHRAAPKGPGLHRLGGLHASHGECCLAAGMPIDGLVIPIHTPLVKVAISVPDPVCSAVDDAAAALGISRSEFFATAARRYLEELDRARLTASIDEAVSLIGSGGRDPADREWTRRAARRVMERNTW